MYVELVFVNTMYCVAVEHNVKSHFT